MQLSDFGLPPIAVTNIKLSKRSIAMVSEGTTNYDFVLPCKTRQRHSETSAANIWDLEQSDQ